MSLTHDVVTDLSQVAGTPYGCYLVGPGDPLSDEARRLEQQVFYDTFGNTPDLLEAEYGPYEDVSAFLVIVDHERQAVAGMIRLIFDGHGTLKSLADIEHEPWVSPLDDTLDRTGLGDLDLSDVFDVCTLAVHPDYRGKATSGLVSLALYQGVCSIARAAGFRYIVTILDVVVLDLIQTRTHRPFQFYEGVGPKRYLDSPSSVPVWSDLHEYAEKLSEIDPEMEAMLFDSVGLESAISVPDYAWAAEMVQQLSSRRVIDLTAFERSQTVETDDVDRVARAD